MPVLAPVLPYLAAATAAAGAGATIASALSGRPKISAPPPPTAGAADPAGAAAAAAARRRQADAGGINSTVTGAGLPGAPGFAGIAQPSSGPTSGGKALLGQ